MKDLTQQQKAVFGALDALCRRNVVRYRDLCDHLYQADLRKLAISDVACVFGNGGLTSQVGYALGLEPGAVLSTFKALERKGLVIRESSFREYQRPLYWWPVGLAAKLRDELEQVKP